jgi:predicted acylesterase/phospholipase RssA
VRALRQSVLARLDGAHFRELCLRSPDGLVSTVRLGLERLKRNIRRPAVCRNLAVLPVGADAPRFVARLAGALSRIVSAAVHTSVELDARFPALAGLTSDDPRRVRLDAWLDQHELQHELMLYQADSAPTAWSRLCLARADRVLIVADAGCDPEPGALEMAWSAMHRPGFSVPTSLVLLHPTSVERPGATESWLRPRAVDAVHHVRPERADDVARTARIVSGRAIGLALGGGGARGIAHVGVIRALEEAGIPIDVMAGTSTGAVISAQHAMGMRWDAMMEAFRHFAAQKPHRDYSLPLVGLIGGAKFVRAMGAMFGDKRLEDLWLEVGIVSADLSSAKKRVHRRGSIVQALRASCALPAIAVPAVEDGHLLVDGGVLDNVPGRLLRDRCGTVIAVDVSPDVDLVVDPAWDSVPSPWRLLWSRLNPFGTPLAAPTIAEIIARTMVLASRSSRDETMAAADLYLRPPVGEFRTLAVTDFERILEAGYQHARAQLAEWRKTARLPVLD